MMASSPESGDSGSPMRISNRQPSRMKQDTLGTRSSAVTPFMTSRLGNLGSNNNATINETDNIKVAVRVRPLFPDKVDKDSVSVLQVTEDHSTIKVVVPGPAGNKMQRDFQFHACLGPDVSQADVLNLCGIPQLLDAALSGYNVTIFAYGQTGSGKTYTMSGREEVIGLDEYRGDTTDGIITRSVSYIYQQIKERQDCKVQLSASYLEIYNEAVFDLLTSRMSGAASGAATGGLVGGRPVLASKDLGIKWDPAQGFFVPGLKVMPCKTIDAMMDVIRLGMKHRHVGSHQLNMESSRSHSIMTIHCSVVGTDQSAWDYGTPRFGKICFVDLAGSERLKDSKSEGTMLKETTNINKSLFVLGKVISALAERDAAGVTTAHIPYRDSKLTKLLMDSLGGSALALMIACCSPSMNHVEETLSTLSYATRAKNIQNRPTVQYDPKEAQITALRREIELLRQENGYLRDQIRIANGGASLPATPGAPGPSGPSEYYGGALEAPPLAHGSAQLLTGRPDWPLLRGREIPPTPLLPPQPSSPLLHGTGGAYTNQPPNGWAGPSDTHDSGAGYPEASGASGGAGTRQRLQVRMSLGQPGQGNSNNSNLKQRLVSQQLQSSNEWGDGATSVAGEDGGAGEEGPFQLGSLRVGSGSAWRGGPPGIAGLHHGGISDDLSKRLQDTQGLLAKFSEENNRLAKENDRLRMNRAILGNEHAGVLDEIETLRAQLSGLESAVLAGNASPSAAKALLSNLRQGPNTGQYSPTSSMPPSRDVPRPTGTQSVYSSQANLNLNGYGAGGGANAGAQTPGGMPHLLGPQASRFSPDQAVLGSTSWSRTSDELGEAMVGARGSGPETPSRMSSTEGVASRLTDEGGPHGGVWGGGQGSGAAAAMHIRNTADMSLTGLAGPQPPGDSSRQGSFSRQPHGVLTGAPPSGSLRASRSVHTLSDPASQEAVPMLLNGASSRQRGSWEGTGEAPHSPSVSRVTEQPTPGSASRSRGPSYGEAGPGKGRVAEGGVIVANQGALALLLGDGPTPGAPTGSGMDAVARVGSNQGAGMWGQGICAQPAGLAGRPPPAAPPGYMGAKMQPGQAGRGGAPGQMLAGTWERAPGT